MRYCLRLEEYDYEVNYIEGSSNKADWMLPFADGLAKKESVCVPENRVRDLEIPRRFCSCIPSVFRKIMT